MLGDALQHGLQVERGRHLAPDLGSHGHLVSSPFGFIQQARVFEGDAQGVGQGLHQAYIRGAEAVFLFQVLDRDDGPDLFVPQQRHEQGRFGPLSGQHRVAGFQRQLLEVLVDQQGFAGLDDLQSEAVRWARRKYAAVAVFIRVRHAEQSPVSVVRDDVHHLHAEHLAHLFADQLVDGLHFQPGGQAFLHAVDDRQLGIALFGLLEQALGLVE